MQNWLTTKRFYILLFVLFILSIFSAIPILELRGEEPRRALVAIEMILSGNYTVPTLNGECYYNKPPFFNWALVILFKLFNSFDEWIVRLPSTLGYILIGLVHFFVTKKYINKNVAILSTLFFYTSAHIYFYTSIQTGEIDLFYSFIVYLQAISFFVFYQRKQFLLMFSMSYLLMAVGFLTKGLTSIAFQGITILALSIYHKDYKLLLRWQNILGLVVSLAIIGIYFSWYGKYDDPSAYIVKLFNESSEKSTIGFSFFQTILAFVEFPFLIISKTLPWSLLAFLPFFYFKTKKTLPNNSFVRFSLLFIVSNIIIYWITPGARIRYLFMFFPFIFTAIAYYSEQFFTKKHVLKTGNYFVLILNTILLIIILIFPFLKLANEILEIRYLGLILIPFVFLNFYFAKRNPEKWILSLAMILIIARLEMNLTYWPLSHKNDFKYLELIEKSKTILDEGEKIYFTGDLREFSNTISIGTLNIFRSKTDVVMPPYINYKIPYYITRDKQYIMQYHKEPQRGKYYIADFNFVEGKENIEKIFTYRYKNKFNKGAPEYVLFKVK